MVQTMDMQDIHQSLHHQHQHQLHVQFTMYMKMITIIQVVQIATKITKKS